MKKQLTWWLVCLLALALGCGRSATITTTASTGTMSAHESDEDQGDTADQGDSPTGKESAAETAIGKDPGTSATPAEEAGSQPSQPPAETRQQPTPSEATGSESTAMSVSQATFGTTRDGQEVTLYTCVNRNGLILKLIDYGAIVVALETPDKNGHMANITLGFPNLAGYLERHPYFGATVGRYANRIAQGQFTLEGKTYQLATNNGPNHLHGGEKGFDKVLWDAAPIETENGVGVRFSRTSPDGEEGYPGAVRVAVDYVLTNDNELVVEFKAESEQPTVVNLTNHNYWNLGGAGSGTILDHQMMIAADQYLPVDDTLIPTGERKDAAGTPMDFTAPQAIGSRIDQLTGDPGGYDHCYVLRDSEEPLRLAARVKDPESGRVMEIHTTQPGIQFYTGNFLDGTPANGGFPKHAAFCLETQHFPDSPNQPDFPSTILKPGETFHQKTVHRFTAE